MIRWLIVNIVLAASLTSGAERVVAVLPSCAKMIPRRDGNVVLEAKSLLLSDADAVGWKFTRWDIDMVASANTFVSIGLPEERDLLYAVKNIKSNVKIVDAGMNLRKIDGNPYFFISSDNLASIKANVWNAFNYGETIMCGSPKTAPLSMRQYFEKKSYVVAIAHPAFEYECKSYGVECVLIEPSRLDTDERYYHETIERLKNGRANILLSLPGYSRVPQAFLLKARLRNVEFDMFNGDLCSFADILFQNALRRDSNLAEYEEKEKAQASVLLSAVRFARFEALEDATVQSVIDSLQSAIDASDKIDLPKEKRKLKIDFSLVPGEKSKVLGHFVLENASGIDVFSKMCAKANCRFTECSHSTCGGEDFGVLYVVRDSGDTLRSAMEGE